MSQTRSQPGCHIGVAGQALHVTIRGPGSKNSLAVIFSYDRSIAFDAPSFRGGLGIFNGEVSPNGTTEFGFVPGGLIIDPLTIDQQRLFDVSTFSPDPNSFLFPIAELQGSARSQDGLTLTIIQYKAGTINPGEIFTPKLVVSIQTISGYA